jgi:hypothetical protein
MTTRWQQRSAALRMGKSAAMPVFEIGSMLQHRNPLSFDSLRTNARGNERR